MHSRGHAAHAGAPGRRQRTRPRWPRRSSRAACVLAALDDDVELVIDDGECRYGEPATVVEVNAGCLVDSSTGSCEGVDDRPTCLRIVLFICTGNTCRSPLAEGFFRKMLADRLHCAEDELADHGYMVLSAGMSAEPGCRPVSSRWKWPDAPASIFAAHESQPVTERLLEQADRIFTMTQGHQDALLASYPRLATRVEFLARDNSDISDPIGRRRKNTKSALRSSETCGPFWTRCRIKASPHQ